MQFVPIILVLACGQAPPIGAPPAPDFNDRVDYVEWYNYQLRFAEEDNAYQDYRRFMASKRPLQFPSGKKAAFQKWLLHPRPWRSEEFPKISEWIKELQPQLSAFMAGSRRRYYAHPTRSEARSVLEILDPGFTRSRTISQALMMEAWKADPEFKGENFIPRVGAILRHTHHLHQGISTFEHLQALRIRNMVYDHIVAAVHAKILTLADLQNLQAVLKKDDAQGYHQAIARGLYHEVAGVYDMIQDICSTDEALQPKFNQDKLSTWMPRFGKDPKSPQAEMIVKEEPKQLCDMAGKHYRFFMQVLDKEHPKNLSREYKDRYQKMTASSAFMHTFLANFERTFELFTAGEVKRRGTHLLVTLAIQKKKDGGWPKDLKRVAPPLDKTMLRDPFSGKRFVYRTSAEGMTLYSVGKDGADNAGRMPARIYDFGDAEDMVIWPLKTPKKTEPAKSEKPKANG